MRPGSRRGAAWFAAAAAALQLALVHAGAGIAGAQTKPDPRDPVVPQPPTIVVVTDPVRSSAGDVDEWFFTQASSSVDIHLRGCDEGPITAEGDRSYGSVTPLPGENVLEVHICDRESGPGKANCTDLRTTVYHVLGPRVAARVDTASHPGHVLRPPTFDATLRYATVPYLSRDVSRNATFGYRASQAAPMGMLQLDVTEASQQVPAVLSLGLIEDSGARVLLANGTYENFFRAGTGLNRLSAQFRAYGRTTTMVVDARNPLTTFYDPDSVKGFTVAYDTLSGRATGWTTREMGTTGGFMHLFYCDRGFELSAVSTPTIATPQGSRRVPTRYRSLPSLTLPAAGGGTTLATPASRVHPDRLWLRVQPPVAADSATLRHGTAALPSAARASFTERRQRDAGKHGAATDV